MLPWKSSTVQSLTASTTVALTVTMAVALTVAAKLACCDDVLTRMMSRVEDGAVVLRRGKE